MRLLSLGGALVCLVLAACGGQPWCEPESAGPATGGPVGGGSGGDPLLLQAPQLTLDVTYIKTFGFAWSAVAGATVYRLIEDIDGPTGPQAARVIAEVPADRLSFSTEVFLPDRINASYQVQACNGASCSPASTPTGVARIDDGIGFFKPSRVAPDEGFGAGLAISADGHLLAVGVPRESGENVGIDSAFLGGEGDALTGAVYVFHRGSNGWVQEAYIKPDQTPVDVAGEFGSSLALAGDAQGYTLLVGAPFNGAEEQGVGGANPGSGAGTTQSGAAYVFERAASGAWSQHSYIKAEVVEPGARFGWSVSLSQDRQWAAVGQPTSLDGGSVALYQRLPGGWAFRQSLQGGNTEADDAFGTALQLDAGGETLVVGAPGEAGSTPTAGTAATDDDGAPGAGAVYAFRRTGAVWEQVTYLKAAQRGASQGFGQAVALSSAGNVLVVGEPFVAVGAGPSVGKVHLLNLTGSDWVVERDFISPLGLSGNTFGAAVSLAADADGATLVIGDPLESTAGAGLTHPPLADGQTVASGTVFVYRRDGTGAWSAPVSVKAPNNRSDLRFGFQLALSANRGALAVSGLDSSGFSGIGRAPESATTDTSASNSGAVYLY